MHGQQAKKGKWPLRLASHSWPAEFIVLTEPSRLPIRIKAIPCTAPSTGTHSPPYMKMQSSPKKKWQPSAPAPRGAARGKSAATARSSSPAYPARPQGLPSAGTMLGAGAGDCIYTMMRYHGRVKMNE